MTSTRQGSRQMFTTTFEHSKGEGHCSD